MSKRRLSRSNCTSLTRQGVPGRPKAKPKTVFSSMQAKPALSPEEKKEKRFNRELKRAEPASSSLSSPVLRSPTQTRPPASKPLLLPTRFHSEPAFGPHYYYERPV